MKICFILKNGGKGMERKLGNTTFKVVKNEWTVYFDMAMAMLDVIKRNNEIGKNTVMIVPVGPTDQYPILAEMINKFNVSLKNVHFFNMDEYMISPTESIDPDHPMSFHKRMETEFYSLVREDLVMPKEQRHFPEPGKEAEYDKLIEDLGGVDACFGGLGINGHIAFNEPPEADEKLSAEEFGNLVTRVLPISRETKTINAYGYHRGDLRRMPECCITIGMKQILSAKEVYIALNRPWQHGIAKHALFDEPQAAIPASLLQKCGKVCYCTYPEVAEGLFD